MRIFEIKFSCSRCFENCANKENQEKYFFVGRMKIKIDDTCEIIELKDFNNNNLELKLENNPELNF